MDYIQEANTIYRKVKNMKVMKCKGFNSVDNAVAYFKHHSYKTLIGQYKYNGARAYWVPEEKKLFSSGDREILSVPHIVKALQEYKFPFDGELFHPVMEFNRINGAVRTLSPTEDSLQLKFYIFDLCQPLVLQENRILALDSFELNSPLVKCPSFNLSIHELNILLRASLFRGFEGIILRNPKAYYRPGYHAHYMWKIKPIYKVVVEFIGFEKALPGTERHLDTFGSLILRSLENGRTFKCSGLTEMERYKLWNNPPEPGTLISVKFGAWSHKEPSKRVPLYPRYDIIIRR